jgi:hypothetical protein
LFSEPYSSLTAPAVPVADRGEIRIKTAEGRDFLMHAHIGMLRALHRNEARVFNPDRKDTHWGKRKLKRDE